MMVSLHQWTRATDVIYLDFTKAFDTVPPQHPSLQIGKIWIFWAACSIGKELAAGSSPKSGGQLLNVRMEISDEWCPPGVTVGADIL